MSMRYSKESYRHLIQLALENGYRFVGFLDQVDYAESEIHLRHDVDYSLDMAVELAQVNATLGVRGTFFVLLRSQIYNLLSNWSIECVQRLLSLGQGVAFHCAMPPGLHFDDPDLPKEIFSDFRIARQAIPELEAVFSWHNPPVDILRRNREFVMEGLISAYSAQFTENVSYFSDSNMRHSVEDFEKILGKREHRSMQLLLHPFNWVAGGTSMPEVLAKTWQYVIKEREYEIVRNTTYQRLMPGGMPESVLEEFSRSWINATLQEKSQAS